MCSSAKSENMNDDHNNNDTIDQQDASDSNYDSGTDGNEYSSEESDPKEIMINEDYWELLRVCTWQNYNKQTSICESD